MIIKNIVFIIGALFFLSSFDKLYCYNHQLLESYADSFNERIWSNISTPLKLIEEKLDFLDREEEQNIQTYSRKNILLSYESKIESMKNEEFKGFFRNCQQIYREFEDLDPLPQAAVQILFERVSKKYEEHEQLLACVSPLLPKKNSENNTNHTHSPDTPSTPGATKSLFSSSASFPIIETH